MYIFVILRAKLLFPDSGAQVFEYSELLEKDWHRDVAVKGEYLPVLQMKDITAWGMHLLVGRRNNALRKVQVSLVCAVQRQLHNDNIIVEIHVVKLTVHVGEGGGVVIHGVANIFSVVLLSRTDVVEIATFAKHRNE